MEDQRRREHQTRKMAKKMAGLMVLFRSTALFYPTRESRRAVLERLLLDVRFAHIARTYTAQTVVPPSARDAVIQFCSAHIGVYDFGSRVKKAFRKRPNVSIAVRGRTRDEESSRVGSDESVGGEISRRIVERSEPRRRDRFWWELYGQLRSLIGTPGTDYDDYDARIEFARRIELDLRYGRSGGDGQKDLTFIAPAECIATLTSIGHLNKSMVATDVSANFVDAESESGDVNTKYPVFLFGSNFVWILSDAMYTLQNADRRPPAFESDSQVAEFVRELASVGIDFIPGVQVCRRTAVERNRPVLTSVSRNDVSFQFSFAMSDGDLYTAHVFYMKSDDACSTDFRHKRQTLSNICQCENRLVHWRVCVSVAAFDGREIAGLVGNSVSEFVVTVIRAFERTKVDQGAHYYVNQFMGLALINYTDDSIALGGMNDDVNYAPDNSLSDNCDLHRWLGTHDDAELWRSHENERVIDLLARTPQLLVVHRPFISELACAANGPNIFLKYKTFDDIVLKYVLLSLETLERGYANEKQAVAYKGSDTFYTFSYDDDSPTRGGDRETVSGTLADEAAGPSWARTAGEFGSTGASSTYGRTGPSTRGMELRGEVSDLFQRVFSAPSRLYVHVTVLSRLGFNVTSAGSELSVRAFTHTETDSTDNRCTVICSSPLVVTDDKTGRPVKSSSGSDETLRVLKHSSNDSVVEKYTGNTESSVVRRFRKSVVSLNEFWPGVHAVRISFIDTVLENVHFVFFTSSEGQKAVARLNGDILSRLCRYNVKSSFQLLPPPVMYALQRWFVRVDETAGGSQL